jgi:hypothetical protein
MTWIIAHWEIISIIIGVLISIANAASPHFSKAKSWYAVIFLVLTEALSFIRSKGDAPGTLGNFKWPLFIGELMSVLWNAFNKVGSTKILLHLALVAGLGGCATIGKQISSMDAVIAKLSPVAVGAFHARCEGEAQACKAKKVASDACIGWLKCCQGRRALQELLDDAQMALSLAMRFAAVSDEDGARKAIVEAAVLVDKVYRAVKEKKLVIP